MRQKWRDALKRVVIFVSRLERTGWRDAALSERHRRYGLNCPMTDIDFLCVEYDSCEARALIEYKGQRAPQQFPNAPQYRTLVNLGNRAALPVFAVRYADDFSSWRVAPLNGKAKEILKKQTTLTEQQFVKMLYYLRGREAPQDVLDNLDKDAIFRALPNSNRDQNKNIA